MKTKYEIEHEAIQHFDSMCKSLTSGDWDPSYVEEKDYHIRASLIRSEEYLKSFMTNWLSAGRLNFPDSPDKGVFFNWTSGKAIPFKIKLKGYIVLIKQIIRLRKLKSFRLEDLSDSQEGAYGFYFPKSLLDLAISLPNILLGRSINPSRFIQITESKLRVFYYESEIRENINEEINTVLEIGGGYGGLASQILENNDVSKYYIVDLHDALPLAYCYLKKKYPDYKIQCLSDPDIEIKDDANIILIPPWRADEIAGEVDISISTMSMQHQTESSVTFYLKKFDNLKSKFIFQVERDSKRDPSDIAISDYPFPDSYKRVVWKRYLFDNHILAIHKREV